MVASSTPLVDSEAVLGWRRTFRTSQADVDARTRLFFADRRARRRRLHLRGGVVFGVSLSGDAGGGLYVRSGAFLSKMSVETNAGKRRMRRRTQQ